jgi:exonuclease III
MVSSKGVKGSECIRRYLRDNRNRAYDFYHHSTSNGRGVAILIAMSLNTKVSRIWRDQAENILVMDISSNGCDVTIGSVYGPNNTGREFYRFLNLAIGESVGKYKVIGGDWNTVLDPLPVQHNIDVINMAALPNPANLVLLRKMYEPKEVCDPYRVLYPTKRDYSYTLFGDTRKNRSRLDFFLISNNLIPALEQCSISPSVLCALFDHKNISMSINCKPDHTAKKRS